VDFYDIESNGGQKLIIPSTSIENGDGSVTYLVHEINAGDAFCDGMLYLGSISSTFYEQLLRAKDPKCEKNSQVICIIVFLRFWVKAACKTSMKLTPGAACSSPRSKSSSSSPTKTQRCLLSHTQWLWIVRRPARP